MRSDGLCACATCDSEYPPRVAFSLLGKILEEFDGQVPGWQKEKRNEALGILPFPCVNHSSNNGNIFSVATSRS
jgi:Regulated-SNARE-like domain